MRARSWKGGSVGKTGKFRRELKPGGGLSSYSAPWLMRIFGVSDVSMGLSPLMAIIQARFSGIWKIADEAGDGRKSMGVSLGMVRRTSRNRLAITLASRGSSTI